MSPHRSPRLAALRDFGRALLQASSPRPPRLLLAACGLLLALPALGQERAWIPNNGDGTVSEIDVDTNTVVATLALGGDLQGVAVSATGDRVYITDSSASVIDVIDAVTATLAGTIPVGLQPFAMAVSPDGTRLYVTNSSSNDVSIIDTGSLTVVATVDVGDGPRGILVTPDGQSVYVANALAGISVIDTTTHAVSSVSAVPNPTALAIDPTGSFVYVASSLGDLIHVIDTSTLAVNTFPGPASAALIASPDGARLYVADYGTSSVDVLDPATGASLGSVGVGNAPYSMDATADGSRLYVVNHDSNSVSVIDTAALAVVDTIAVGVAPVGFGHFIGPYFAPTPPSPATGVDLSASPASPLVYAAEIVASPGSPVSLDNTSGVANLTTPLDYNFSPGEVRYARVECSGGMVFAGDATVFVGGGALTAGAINGLNGSAIYFSVTATAATGDGTWLTVDGGRRIAGTDPVTCTYGLYDMPSQAVAGGSPGRVASVSGAYLDFAPSTSFTADARMSIADVEADPAFAGFVANGATTDTTAALGALHMGLSSPAALKPDGTAITLADLHATGADGTRFVVDGDFSAAANDDGSFDGAALDRVYLSANAGTCTFAGGLPADALEADEAVFAIGATATDRMLCLAPTTATPIPAADYTARLVAVAASADYALPGIGPLDAGRITRNGTELQAPLVQVPTGWLSRLVLTNTGSVARPYAIAVTGESGNAIDTGQLTGSVPARGTSVIDLHDVLTGFSGQPRATLNVTIAGPNAQIQGLYQVVNAATGSISNHVLVRPGSN
jgi:YVTN family beta-propeller protein